MNGCDAAAVVRIFAISSQPVFNCTGYSGKKMTGCLHSFDINLTLFASCHI